MTGKWEWDFIFHENWFHFFKLVFWGLHGWKFSWLILWEISHFHFKHWILSECCINIFYHICQCHSKLPANKPAILNWTFWTLYRLIPINKFLNIFTTNSKAFQPKYIWHIFWFSLNMHQLISIYASHSNRFKTIYGTQWY